MSGNGKRLIAREGIPVLAILLLATVLCYVFSGFALSLFFAALLLSGVFLFRDPVCEVPADPLAIVSPASGEIVSICEVEDYRLSRRAQRVRIKLSLGDTHSLRSPIEGKVLNQWHSSEAGGDFQRYCAFWIQTDESDDLVLGLGMDAAAMFTRMTLSSGQRAGQGQRCGFLYLSGTIDVYVPENARIELTSGEHVCAGTTILAHFVRK